MPYRSAPFAALLAGLLIMMPARLDALETPSVVATVKPIHSIVSAVMEGIGSPELLVGDNASPHGYALRPSDARALGTADLVVMVGGGLERFLDGPIEELSGSAEIVAFAAIDGIAALAQREHAEDDEHGDDDDAIDPHLWLDADNVMLLTTHLADVLARMDPANRDRYRENAQRFLLETDKLDREIDAMLAPYRERPFIVFHDGYQYLEARYRLNAKGAITIDPERSPGARRIRELRDIIESRNAVCLFTEPPFTPRIAETLIEGTDVRTGNLDPIGQGLTPGPRAYETMMRNNAEALRDCLSGE